MMYVKREKAKHLIEQDLQKRSVELKALEDGWFDGNGVAPSHKLIDDVIDLCLCLKTEHGFMFPFMFPLIDGGITLEWSIGAWDVTVDINNQSDVYAHVMNTVSDFSEEHNFQMNVLPKDFIELIQICIWDWDSSFTKS